MRRIASFAYRANVCIRYTENYAIRAILRPGATDYDFNGSTCNNIFSRNVCHVDMENMDDK